MHSAERLSVCLVLLFAFALPARGQAGLPLARLLHAARDAPDLLRQIDVELRRNDLKANDVACAAGQLGSQFRFLGGGAAAPYECQFGERQLRVEADRIFFDVNAKRIGRAGEVSDEVLFNRAKSFREVNLRWSWTPENPR